MIDENDELNREVSQQNINNEMTAKDFLTNCQKMISFCHFSKTSSPVNNEF